MRERSQALPPSSLPIILPPSLSLSYNPAQHNPTLTQKPKKSMLLSKQPLSQTKIYNSVETSVNSDGEHSKSLADEEGDYAKASELYSRSLESADFNSDGDFVSSGVDLNGDFDKVSVDLKFDGDGVSRDFKLLRDGLNVRVCVGRLTDSGNIFFRWCMWKEI